MIRGCQRGQFLVAAVWAIYQQRLALVRMCLIVSVEHDEAALADKFGLVQYSLQHLATFLEGWLFCLTFNAPSHVERALPAEQGLAVLLGML